MLDVIQTGRKEFVEAFGEEALIGRAEGDYDYFTMRGNMGVLRNKETKTVEFLNVLEEEIDEQEEAELLISLAGRFSEDDSFEVPRSKTIDDYLLEYKNVRLPVLAYLCMAILGLSIALATLYILAVKGWIL